MEGCSQLPITPMSRSSVSTKRRTLLICISYLPLYILPSPVGPCNVPIPPHPPQSKDPVTTFPPLDRVSEDCELEDGMMIWNTPCKQPTPQFTPHHPQLNPSPSLPMPLFLKILICGPFIRPYPLMRDNHWLVTSNYDLPRYKIQISDSSCPLFPLLLHLFLKILCKGPLGKTATFTSATHISSQEMTTCHFPITESQSYIMRCTSMIL